jgi:hypothetical protein
MSLRKGIFFGPRKIAFPITHEKAIFSVSEKSLIQVVMKRRFFQSPKKRFSGSQEKGIHRLPKNRFFRFHGKGYFSVHKNSLFQVATKRISSSSEKMAFSGRQEKAIFSVSEKPLIQVTTKRRFFGPRKIAF